MALRVWLPLNGTLDNIGISDVTITNNDVVIDNNGKIGKCYKFNGTSSYLLGNYSPFTNNTQEWSYACWFKPENSHYGCLLSVRTATAATGITVFYYGSQFLIDDGVRWEFTPSTAVKIGEWNHLAVTRKVNSGKKLYLNGELINTIATTGTPTTVSTTNFSIGASQSSATSMSGNFFNGLINDVRIYDHCLSLKEIKEISQGLVLHYKLGGFDGGAGENLVKGSNTNDTSTNKWFGHSAVGGNTSTIEQDETGTYCVKVTRNEVEQSSWDYLSYDNFLRNNIKISTFYTISFDCKPSVDGSISFTGFVNGNATNYMTNSKTTIQGNCIANQWNHMVYQCKTIDSFDDITVGSQVVYFSRSTSLRGINVSVLFKNIKVEEGLTETAWTPNTDELGIDITKITDSSGYGNDGIIVGTIATQQDSPKYGISTSFAASSAINCGRGAMVTDSITVNLWAKYSSYSNLASCTESGGWNFENNSGLTFPVYIANVGYVHIDAANRPPVANYANSWHMFTGVYDRLNKLTKLYIDGELIGTGAVSSPNLIQYHTSNVIWLNAEATGSNETGSYGNAKSFSDFRIYATALSAEDILDLYHTSANVDNLGGLHGFEFIDNTNNRIMEANGTIATKNWNNSTLLKNYQQTNCQVTLTDDGLRIYRPPNIIHDSSTMHNMWGGMRINNTRDGDHPVYGNGDNPIGLEKGHTYIIAFHVKGKSSNATNNYGWSNQMGWGGGGLGPTPTDVSYDLLPSNFNGEKECWYKWTINDDIVKTCTTSYSYAVAGNQYMSYADFAFGWQYQDTGALGSDVYITNLRLYDITDLDMSNIQKNGVINFTQLDELTQTDKASITFYKELQATGFIEK